MDDCPFMSRKEEIRWFFSLLFGIAEAERLYLAALNCPFYGGFLADFRFFVIFLSLASWKFWSVRFDFIWIRSVGEPIWVDGVWRLDILVERPVEGRDPNLDFLAARGACL